MERISGRKRKREENTLMINEGCSTSFNVLTEGIHLEESEKERKTLMINEGCSTSFNELMEDIRFVLDLRKPIKLIILGDPETGNSLGKTSLLRRLPAGEYLPTYNHTVDVEAFKVEFSTSRGKMVFECWDVAGQDQSSLLKDSCYLNGRGAIIMFDLTNKKSYNNISAWHNELECHCKDIPIILCGNKLDVERRRVRPVQITYHRKNNLGYCELSCKNAWNLEAPFVYLARKITEDDQLHLEESTAPARADLDLITENLKTL